MRRHSRASSVSTVLGPPACKHCACCNFRSGDRRAALVTPIFNGRRGLSVRDPERGSISRLASPAGVATQLNKCAYVQLISSGSATASHSSVPVVSRCGALATYRKAAVACSQWNCLSGLIAWGRAWAHFSCSFRNSITTLVDWMLATSAPRHHVYFCGCGDRPR